MWHKHIRLGLILSACAAGLSAAPAWAAFDRFTPETASATAGADSADGRRAALPSIKAHRLNGGGDIRLDGKLDDTAWRDCEPARGFRVWDPDRGASPSEETIFKVAYDERAVYFGVACLERDPSKITAKLSRRDRDSKSDLVSIYIDPYFDHTTGYNFRVNPLGVQVDSYIYNDGDRDDDWDAVWEAETYRDENGWYAEIRIPFSAIRYRTGASMTWGLQIYRYMHGRGEDTAWVIWDRTAHGMVSHFGTLTGLEGIRPPRQVELLPYFVQRSTDPSMEGPGDKIDGFQNVGADLKSGITADLTLNATIQPDFGQVEADPATLNLSPFETFYEEKRPFFIEGNRFFQHPDFNLFYSRRIGTGDENTRIRYAAKLTGKTFGGISLAALAASTDVTGQGQAHNIFKDGSRLSRYAVTRLGKEFAGGRHRFNVMQTAVVNTASRDLFGDFASREAYTTGLDFDLNSKNRDFNAQGSFVGSIINPEKSAADPTITGAPVYGTGGALDLRRRGGKLQGGVSGRWEGSKLQINDLGYLQAPDEISSSGYLYYPYDPKGKSKTFNRGELNLNAWRSWIYAGRTGRDAVTGAEAWRYGPGHPQYSGVELSGWMQFRNYRELWGGTTFNGEGTHRWETREGPLIREPLTYGGWIGGATDTRKNLNFNLEVKYFVDTSRNASTDVSLTTKWNQSSAVNHNITLKYSDRMDDTQWLENVTLSQRPGGIGIGGVSYVFGDIHQRTVDLTLRSNIIFTRNQSLELYAQPFLTVGDYSRVRELIHPDSYDFYTYLEPGYEARDRDFSFASVNVNAVYRWEYRPGSTFYLVWTQGRSRDDTRMDHVSNPNQFHNDLSGGPLFRSEPENTILAKITYWIAI
ncbi:MAG TPA: DUF5916 domain-containing protein [Candidatus Eisenbacteria bacterium]|nr:DUF5916 domain-containing protein [Candidatus Eisenbacteria bacterium]